MNGRGILVQRFLPSADLCALCVSALIGCLNLTERANGETRKREPDETFLPEQCWSDGEGKDDVFHVRQWLAGLKIAPYVSVPVGEATKSLALHHREIFDRGVRFFFFAYGKVAHGLDHGCFYRRLLLWDFNLHKILKAAAQSSQGSS